MLQVLANQPFSPSQVVSRSPGSSFSSLVRSKVMPVARVAFGRHIPLDKVRCPHCTTGTGPVEIVWRVRGPQPPSPTIPADEKFVWEQSKLEDNKTPCVAARPPARCVSPCVVRGRAWDRACGVRPLSRAGTGCRVTPRWIRRTTGASGTRCGWTPA